MLAQRTLNTLTRAVGVGLHSGQRVELTLRPAPPDTGIVFRRVDLPEPVDIPVCAEAVTDTRLASTISAGQAKVLTIEHLMSACAGLGIDNLYVDIDAEEVPILDGSASSFVFLLQSAGVAEQKAPKRFIRVLKPVQVTQGEGDALKWARLVPYHGYRLSFEIDFHHPAVDNTGQQVVFDMSEGIYARDIARPHLWLHQGCGDAARQWPGAGRRSGQRHRDGRLQSAQQRRLALRRRICETQNPRCHGRFVFDRQTLARVLHRVSFWPRHEQQTATSAARPTRRLRGGHL